MTEESQSACGGALLTTPEHRIDIDAVLSQLTLEEKAALTLGSDFWHTAPVERLSIESIMVSDGPHGLRAQLEEADHVGLSGSVPATCFPTASALGSSWNPNLFNEVGQALAREARACGVSVVLGPGINMKRSPLCGRNFEYVAEDPWLAGELATAMVQGLQSLGIGTSPKHYAANNQESDRLRVSAEVDERTLREIYLPAFERVVTSAQPWTVMCAYNKVNGTYASEHHWLLTEVLREEWGFEGLVVSDWGAVHDRVAALAAGLDLEMPPNHALSRDAVVDAVNEGRLDESVLDTAVRRVLRLVGQARPARAEGGEFDVDEHHRLAHRAALESAVLLKNDGGVLPLDPDSGSTVAVIGEFARTPRFQGAGSSQVNPTRVDVLVEALAAVHDRLIVVLANGSAVTLSTWEQHAAAVLECWLSGQAAGGAAADLLLGRANPSGKLAESLPRRLADCAASLNFPGDSGVVRYGEGLFIGYRNYDKADLEVSHPFGFGLSYTTFALADLDVRVGGSVADGDLAVSVAVSVTNTGSEARAEGVQVYVRDVEASVARPVRELKAFTKVWLEPGETQRATVSLDQRSFAFWSIVHSRWVVEAGAFELRVGTSSRDLPLAETFTLDAPSIAAPLGRDSTLHEWLADEEGRRLLLEVN